MQNSITTPAREMSRPNGRNKLSSEKLNNQLKTETDVALHSIKIFCIKNCLWLIPLIIIIAIVAIIDLCVVLGVWKNPVILFEQLKIAFSYIIAYILGLVTDYIRGKMTKPNPS